MVERVVLGSKLQIRRSKLLAFSQLARNSMDRDCDGGSHTPWSNHCDFLLLITIDGSPDGGSSFKACGTEPYDGRAPNKIRP